MAGITGEGSCFDSNDLAGFVYFLFLASVILWLYWVILSNCSVPDWWFLLWYESYIRKIRGQALMKYIALLWCRDYISSAFSGVTAKIPLVCKLIWFSCKQWRGIDGTCMAPCQYKRESTFHTWHTGTHTKTQTLSAGFIYTSGKRTEKRASTLKAQDLTNHI